MITINYKRNPQRNPDLFWWWFTIEDLPVFRGRGGPPFTNQEPTLLTVQSLSFVSKTKKDTRRLTQLSVSRATAPSGMTEAIHK